MGKILFLTFTTIFVFFICFNMEDAVNPQGIIIGSTGKNMSTLNNTEKKSGKAEKPVKEQPVHVNLTLLKKIQKTTNNISQDKNVIGTHGVQAGNVTALNQTESTNIGLPKINQTYDENNEIESGAITRGILVFVAVSFLFILYVGIKTCRRKSRDKKRTMVRKYGIRARRTDIEMEPLPLSDEEEDETVFDLTASRGNS